MKHRFRGFLITMLILLTFWAVISEFSFSASAITRPAYHWHSGFILTFHGKRYEVSTSRVVGVGRYIGGISFHGSKSGYFPLYSIPGVSGYLAIAVKTSTGYLLAVKSR